ncbi:hypothetical protein AMTRI_Chr07g31210 [Amborella trichopoda]
MEVKVKSTMKLIEEDADSFAKRADIFYKKRHELVNLVEELYMAHRALTERCSHISGNFHSANSTIATVFPKYVVCAGGFRNREEFICSSYFPKGSGGFREKIITRFIWVRETDKERETGAASYVSCLDDREQPTPSDYMDNVDFQARIVTGAGLDASNNYPSSKYPPIKKL